MSEKVRPHKTLEIGLNADNRIPEMSYLKGFSIFTIALMHLMDMMPSMPPRINTLAAIGGTGAHVFFLCSGIGLYLSYLKRKMDYAEFLKKRFIKIYIPYILVIILSFFLPWMYHRDDRFLALLSHIFLFKMFVPRFESSFGTQFWFLSTIIQLYLLFIPMCLLKEKLRNNKLFFGLFLGVSVCWWILCYALGIANERIWSSFCLQYIWEFALGIVLADAFAKGKVYRTNQFVLLIVAVAGIGLQAGMAVVSDELTVFNDIPALFGYGALALLLMNLSPIRKAAIWLSDFSYEYYLVHILVFETLYHITGKSGLMQQCVVGCIGILLAIGAAFLYHKLIRRLWKAADQIGR